MLRPNIKYELNTSVFIREKLRELNNELLKKTSFIDEMELKYSASSECGDMLKPDLVFWVVWMFHWRDLVMSQLREWRSWRRRWRRKMKTWSRWKRDTRNTWKRPRAWVHAAVTITEWLHPWLDVSSLGDPNSGPQAEPGIRPRGPGPEEPAAGEGENAALTGGDQLLTC